MKELLGGFFKKANVRRTWLLISVFALGVIMMLIGGYANKRTDISDEDGADTLLPLYDTAGGADFSEFSNYSDYERALEQKLENTLSTVKGVGKVRVMLSSSYKGAVELAEDTVYETAQISEEGKTNLTEKKETKHVIITGKGGQMEPIIVKRIEPKIEGVIIVAEGGDKAEIRTALTKAAGALLNLPAHKIEILKMG